jgi:hypothetical protein
LDVFNIKLRQERSPGPAYYYPQKKLKLKGTFGTAAKPNNPFPVPESPGVGVYNIDVSSFKIRAKRVSKDYDY